MLAIKGFLMWLVLLFGIIVGNATERLANKKRKEKKHG